MKSMKIISVLLLSVCLLLGLCSCTLANETGEDNPKQSKVEKEVFAYLKEKYPNHEFEIREYTQEKDMSGRYEVKVLCKNTNVLFEVYHAPILTTDSYAVSQANAYMENDLTELLGAAHGLAKVKSIQWKDSFADASNGYKFREVPIEELPYSTMSVSELYRIRLENIESPNDAAQSVDMVITVLETKGVSLDRVTFEFMLGEDQIIFTTNTHTIMTSESAYDVLEILFTRVKSNEDEGNLFYRNPDSKAKVIEYIIP